MLTRRGLFKRLLGTFGLAVLGVPFAKPVAAMPIIDLPVSVAASSGQQTTQTLPLRVDQILTQISLSYRPGTADCLVAAFFNDACPGERLDVLRFSRCNIAPSRKGAKHDHVRATSHAVDRSDDRRDDHHTRHA